MDQQGKEQLSPEERELELARLQKEKAEYEAQRAKDQAEAEQLRESNRQKHAADTFAASRARTGIKFHMDDTDLQIVLKVAGFSLTPSNSGHDIRVLNSEGQQVTVEKALESLAINRPHLVQSGAEHLGQKRAADGTYREKCKQDYKTTAAKVAYIKEFGLESWEHMPMFPTKGQSGDVNKMGRTDWNRLTLTQRTKIVSEYGSDIVAEIISRP